MKKIKFKIDKTTIYCRDRSAQKKISFDANDVLLYHEQIYVFQDEVFRLELLKRHHNDLLTKHFEFEKTNELLSQKYY